MPMTRPRDSTPNRGFCKKSGNLSAKRSLLPVTRTSSQSFDDEDFLQRLSRFVHPYVMRDFEKWAEAQNAAAVIMESAILFEYDLVSYFDKIIVADAPVELRIQRVLARNPEMTREQILARMSKQMPQEEKCRRADLVVCTGETYAAALEITLRK